MLFLNEYEVDDAVARFHDHPVLGPASLTLQSFANWVNLNSDGWPYWRAAQSAARQLSYLLDVRGQEQHATAAQVRKAYGPIKRLVNRYPDASGVVNYIQPQEVQA